MQHISDRVLSTVLLSDGGPTSAGRNLHPVPWWHRAGCHSQCVDTSGSSLQALREDKSGCNSTATHLALMNFSNPPDTVIINKCLLNWRQHASPTPGYCQPVVWHHASTKRSVKSQHLLCSSITFLQSANMMHMHRHCNCTYVQWYAYHGTHRFALDQGICMCPH